METRTTGNRVSVLQLSPGDLIYLHGIYRVFVCRGQHPIWPELQVVVWCSPEGELEADALSPHQVIDGVVVNKDESPQQRRHRFRQWYLERKNHNA